MKRVILFLSVFIIAMTMPLASSFAYSSFSDVSEANIFYDGIDYVESQGIVEGYDDGTYKPANPINRVEFTKIVIAAKYTQGEIDSCNTSSFSDVGDGAWFTPFVCLAELKGIVSGYPDGTYKPANYVTFAEAAKILTNTFVEPTQDGTDVWYKLHVEKLEDRGAIPVTIVDFAHEITRGEMAEMIYRLQENIRNKDSMTYLELNRAMEENPHEVSFEIDMTNYAYSDTSLTVQQGDTVTINLTNSLGSHNFIIDELDVASLTINSGQTTEVTFVADKVGSFEYYCNIGDHRALGIVGTLIVE